MKREKLFAIAIVAALMMTATTPFLIEDEQEDVEAIEPVTMLAIGLIVGYATGFATGFLKGQQVAAASHQAEVDAVQRQAEIEKVVMAGSVARNLISTILPQDIEVWGLTREHWNRSAEMAVIDLWEYGQIYNPNLTLEKSLMRANVESYIYNWQAGLDNTYTNEIITHINRWSEASYLDSVSSKIVVGPTKVDAYTSVIDFAQLVSSVSSGALIYLDTSTETKGEYTDLTSGMLYKLSSGNVELRNVSSGKVVTLSSDRTLLSTLKYDGTSESVKTGLYKIETAGATLAGPITKATEDNPTNVTGTVVIYGESETMWLTYDGDQTLKNTRTAAGVPVDSVGFEFIYVDRHNVSQTATVPMIVPEKNENIIRDWCGLVSKMSYSIDQAAITGEVLWNIYDVCEETIPYLAPSSIITSVPGMQLTAVQAEAFAIAQMQQIAAAWKLHGAALQAELVQTFSSASLDLYVRADIYYNGVRIAENAVFTPYASIERQDFIISPEHQQWNNTGFAMIWGGSPDISDWGGPDNVADYDPLPLTSGHSFIVKQIGKNGTMVNSFSLVPEKVEKNSPAPDQTPGPQSGVKLGASDWIMIVFIIIALLIVFYAASKMESPKGAILSIIALLVAVFLILILTGTLQDIIKGIFWDSVTPGGIG